MTPTVAVILCAVAAGMATGAALAVRAWRRRPSVDEMADPAFNPSLDRSEARLRASLGDRDDDTDGLIVPPPGWWHR